MLAFPPERWSTLGQRIPQAWPCLLAVTYIYVPPQGQRWTRLFVRLWVYSWEPGVILLDIFFGSSLVLLFGIFLKCVFIFFKVHRLF